MITQIDVASGDILNLIDEKKRPISLAEAEAYLESDKELTYMSIGWLIREGHVQMVSQGAEKYLRNC